MNLTQFLNEVDNITKTSSQETLTSFIYNVARSLPENQRVGFLAKLKETADDISATSKQSELKELEKRAAQIQAELERIEMQEVCLNGMLNEEYDDWYNDTNEYLFSDPDNITDVIEDACDLVHQYIDYRQYEPAYELAVKLLQLNVMVEGDYSDCENGFLSLEDFSTHEIDTFNYQQLVLDMFYSAYWVNPMEKRTSIFYGFFSEFKYSDITLEAVMQNGEEAFERLPEFLALWIEYLGACDGRMADRLLSEAIMLQNDSELLLKAARKFSDAHPELYEQYLRNDWLDMDDSGFSMDCLEQRFQIGKEALAVIPLQYSTRSRIALLTADYALRLGRREEAENCWLRALESDTSPVNFLRLMLESADPAKYREHAVKICRDCFDETKQIKNIGHYYDYSSKEKAPRINEIGRNTYYTLAFLCGDFRHVAEDGMNEKKPLGWSFTFMKQGMALFLLYLNRGNELSAGCRYMCSMAAQAMSFDPHKYLLGTGQPDPEDSTDLFWQCFLMWRTMTPMTAADEMWVLEKLDQWIRLRVEGIMQNNRRNYYGECAGYIAALGEVRESRGEINGKAKLMEDYERAYSRRSAFRQELRACGMRDTRKR